MNIVICDDEMVYRKRIEKAVYTYCREIKGITDVTCYSLSHLSEIIEFKDTIDLLLLDIELEDENGIEFRRYISEKGWETPVVFVSSYDSYISDTFGKNVYGFVKKPIQEQELYHALERVYQECFSQKQYIMNDGTYIKEKDIYKITASADYTYIMAEKGDYLSDIIISRWEEILPKEKFLRIHRSYIVNVEQIESINKEVVLKNGKHVKIGRRRLNDTKEKYEEYLRRKGKQWFV